MMIWEIKDIQKKIANKFGKEEMGLQTVEEMSELMHILLKIRRYEGYGQPTDASHKELELALYDGLTDVIICLKQLMWLYEIDNDMLISIEEDKIDKTKERFGIEE